MKGERVCAQSFQQSQSVRYYTCVCVCATRIHFFQSNSVRYDASTLYSGVRTAAMFVHVCVCVTPNHLNKLHSVRQHTSPLYSIVRTAAMCEPRSVRPFLPLCSTTRLCTECASLQHPAAHIYGRLHGGGGVHSDAKWEIFQFSPFFPTMSFRRGGGGYVIPFQNLQEMAVLERYGLGGGG